MQGTQNSQNNLEKEKRKLEDTHVPTSNLTTDLTVIKTLWY